MTQLTTIRIGHSPDADDAFMFYALAKGLIATEGLKVVHVVEDIESLNQRALTGELEVTAVSVAAYPAVASRYALLPSGASVGDQYGPVVVATRPIAQNDLQGKRIAVPGTLTTAFLALRLFNRNIRPVVVPFDEIIPAVKKRKVDAGVVIHEGQLTYMHSGLHAVLDLGRWWFETTGHVLPLGINAVRKDVGQPLMQKIASVLRVSIQYALDHRDEALDYALEFGRGIPKNLANQFVSMYVNDLTVDLGERGRNGIIHLLRTATDRGLIAQDITPEFVEVEGVPA